MNFIVFLSDFIVPLLVFYIVGFGLLMKKNVYDYYKHFPFLSDKRTKKRSSITAFKKQ